jgi:hypothetical protein
MHRLIISCLAIAGLTALLQADAWNKKTNLTVNESITVPGATLPPGKYVVKLVDSQANRHIVQFTNETEDQVISTVLAIPNMRLEPTGESEFSFYESAEGTPRALRAWFYPGDSFGQQFAYPKEKAMELSRASGEEVPSLAAGDDPASAEVSTVAPKADTTATVAQRTAPPAERPTPSAQPAVPTSEPAPRSDFTILAQAQQPQARPRPTQQPAAGDAESSELPATASPAPLLGLIGLLSLGGALGLRSLSKRKLG